MIENNPDLIAGKSFSDKRGTLISFNNFDMASIKRMYWISPSSQDQIRAWQGHKREQKWFCCINGSFEVKVIKLDNFEKPSPRLDVYTYHLDATNAELLFVPGGYVNGFRSLDQDARLLIYSDFTLKESLEDDFRYQESYWDVWQN